MYKRLAASAAKIIRVSSPVGPASSQTSLVSASASAQLEEERGLEAAAREVIPEAKRPRFASFMSESKVILGLIKKDNQPYYWIAKHPSN